MSALFTWFRRTVLRRVTVTSGSGAHGLYVGDLIGIERSERGLYDGYHKVTRVLSPIAFEARRWHSGVSGMAKYILATVLAFASGAFQLSVAAELAAEGSLPAYVGVAVLGCFIFGQTLLLALVSIQEERAEQLEEERA